MATEMTTNPINQTAFDWLTRVDAGLTCEEEAEFRAWLEADIRHYGAYVRAKSVFAQAQRIKALAHSPNPDEWIVCAETESEDIGQDLREGDYQEVDRKTSRRAFLGGGGALFVAGVAAAFFIESQPAEALIFRTRLGERRNISLADGSKVALNTDTELRVLFGAKFRSVELLHGEALCDVAHDGKRPFIVDTAGFKVRADEASFAIQQLHGTRPRLIVKEGDVIVTPAHSSSLKVSENTRITLTGSQLSASMVSPEELDRELMWRDGKVAFSETPLRSAIATFGRYGPVNITVQDPYLLNLTVSGVFSSNDPMGFARVVAELFDLNVIPQGQGVILRNKE